ncbi:hypothetical protein L2D89_24890, partial [Salmonella enterica subsp. enterica serovar Weltevreden]|nr:hypothetical protein [Salmonella enterica subsp. enterica serovar Weltevreden]
VAIGIGFGVLFAQANAALWNWQRRQASYCVNMPGGECGLSG